MTARFDHLVITAASLAAGTDWVADRLGVRPGPGGRHPRMGTHNTLLRLGEDAYLEALAAAPVSPGTIETMTRGDLAWRITIPPDGRPPWDGALPILIEWPPGRHPTMTMAGSGCSLESMEIHHPEADALRAFLDRIGFGGPVRTNEIPSTRDMAADILTPGGIRRLDGGPR